MGVRRPPAHSACAAGRDARTRQLARLSSRLRQSGVCPRRLGFRRRVAPAGPRTLRGAPDLEAPGPAAVEGARDPRPWEASMNRPRAHRAGGAGGELLLDVTVVRTAGVTAGVEKNPIVLRQQWLTRSCGTSGAAGGDHDHRLENADHVTAHRANNAATPFHPASVGSGDDRRFGSYPQTMASSESRRPVAKV